MRSTAPPDNGGSSTLGRDPFAVTDLGDFVDSFVAEGKGWVSEERNYLMLLLTKRTSEMSHVLLGLFARMILIAAIAMFAGVAASIAIGRAVGDVAVGYLIVSGVYALILLAFMLLWTGPVGDRFKLRMINLLHGH